MRAFAPSPSAILDAAELHVVSDRKPHLFELFSRADRERHRLGELLPNGLQRIEVGVAPFLLAMGWEGRGHLPSPSGRGREARSVGRVR